MCTGFQERHRRGMVAQTRHTIYWSFMSIAQLDVEFDELLPSPCECYMNRMPSVVGWPCYGHRDRHG